MKLVIFSFSLILLLTNQLQAQPKNAADLLDKSIAYHDPDAKWANWAASFIVLQKTPEKPSSTTQIEINNALSLFETQSKKDGTIVRRKVLKDSCFYEVNGNTAPTKAEMEKHKLNCQRNQLFRNYYTYLYGLPMKLKDPGTILDPTLLDDNFQGKVCWGIKITYEAAVGKDIWYFYFDKKTYALIGYRFYHDEAKNDGEYICLEEEEEVNGIKVPKTRKWYMNQDDKFLGTDILQKK